MAKSTTIGRILVANRGEIALRVMRTCRDMGIVAIAVYGDGEEGAAHVRYADEAIRLPQSTGLPYLAVEAIVDAARRAGADAIHPGYGFLAENGVFARAVVDAGMVFIGPGADAITAMGDKILARGMAARAGVESVPGTLEPVETAAAAAEAAATIGYPVAVKASGGGGGRGFRIARTPAELPAAFEGASGEAARYFNNPEVYLERYLERPRHIEVQVMADRHGNVVALGERDCSIQRRHQKLIEESPSTAVDPDLRGRLFEASERLARAVEYQGAGTVEYLLAEDGSFYFLEMNTRIQVEHTVTEMVTGIDLVREQIQVARGEPLSFDRSTVAARGWALECRINAEDPARDFAPVPGTVVTYREPVGFGIRVDGAVRSGDEILPQYDSMIAKVVSWGRDRNECIQRMSRALADFEIAGVPTTIEFHRRTLAHQSFVAGDVSTSFLVDHPEVMPVSQASEPDSPGERIETPLPPLSLVVEVDRRRFETVVHGLPAGSSSTPTQRRPRGSAGRRQSTSVASQDALVSPIHGTVIKVAASEGDMVDSGQVICVVEAMKMENELTAHRSGTIQTLGVAVGATVAIGQVIALIVEA